MIPDDTCTSTVIKTINGTSTAITSDDLEWIIYVYSSCTTSNDNLSDYFKDNPKPKPPRPRECFKHNSKHKPPPGFQNVRYNRRTMKCNRIERKESQRGGEK